MKLKSLRMGFLKIQLRRISKGIVGGFFYCGNKTVRFQRFLFR